MDYHKMIWYYSITEIGKGENKMKETRKAFEKQLEKKKALDEVKRIENHLEMLRQNKSDLEKRENDLVEKLIIANENIIRLLKE